MTAQEAVKLIDESAKLCISCSSTSGYFVKGSNWETPLTHSIENAWELAVYKAASLPVPEVL